VIEVTDALLPDNAGRWELAVDDGVATCRRSDRAPSLALDTRELATVVLGGVRVSQLAAAGRIAVHDATAVARSEAMLATALAPWHEGMF
jgi:predicted acetyltransferase